MRVQLPAEMQSRPFENMGRHYTSPIVHAAGAYGTAPYQHSTLTLRELEAARYRTALINGCQTCTAFTLNGRTAFMKDANCSGW